MEFYVEEIDDNQRSNLKTLNKDILLTKRSNGTWDFDWTEHDLIEANDLYSLQTGIINACLTSWNYMNRYGNPTYAYYGNRAYTLLKQNKSTMTQYKVKVFFEEVLNNMRRVYSIDELEVYEVKNEPYTYKVWFKVRCINDIIVSGELPLRTNYDKSNSFLGLHYPIPFASTSKPLLIDLQLKNEYGSGISGQSLYVYRDDEFLGVTDLTNHFGRVSYLYIPDNYNDSCTLQFRFKGDGLYNGCESYNITLSQEYDNEDWFFEVRGEMLYIVSSDEGTIVPSVELVSVDDEITELVITDDEWVYNIDEFGKVIRSRR